MRKIFLFLVAVFIIIQFFRPVKNTNDTSNAVKNDIATLYPVPNDVKKILQTSCYDCHSNNTIYPWYSNFQPVAWWLNHHVTDGKKHLNFNEFASYRINRQFKKLEEIVDEVKENEMPLSSYTLIHTDAKLDDAQKKILMSWATSLRDTIKAKYPADSLLKK